MTAHTLQEQLPLFRSWLLAKGLNHPMPEAFRFNIMDGTSASSSLSEDAFATRYAELVDGRHAWVSFTAEAVERGFLSVAVHGSAVPVAPGKVVSMNFQVARPLLKTA